MSIPKRFEAVALLCLVGAQPGQAQTFTKITDPGNPIVSDRSTGYSGAAWVDVDGDLDLDLYLDGPNGNRSLFRNDTDNGNHWLKLRLVGVVSNRSAIAAKVRLRARIGGVEVEQLREVSAQSTFNGQASLEVHFGLGDASFVDELRVEWPSGLVQHFDACP